MGADKIEDKDLMALDISIEEKMSDGDRTLKIPEDKLLQYIELIKSGLNNGFWNEIIGSKEIIFIFKFKNGLTKEYKLSSENEQEIGELCAEFANELPEKATNVYKYILNNKFYHDFMIEHYKDMIEREL